MLDVRENDNAKKHGVNGEHYQENDGDEQNAPYPLRSKDVGVMI